jgi:hypothetical protein
MKILKLTLKKKWFDLIASGQKKFEYREYKTHWIQRLLFTGGVRYYDEIRFTNGYGAHRPYLRVKFEGAAIMQGKYCEPGSGEPIDPEQMYFVVALGDVLEIGNTNQFT